jgi:hypothetical protein
LRKRRGEAEAITKEAPIVQKDAAVIENFNQLKRDLQDFGW